MADAEDLKSSGDFSSCGFDSHPGHQSFLLKMNGLLGRSFPWSAGVHCQLRTMLSSFPLSLQKNFSLTLGVSSNTDKTNSARYLRMEAAPGVRRPDFSSGPRLTADSRVAKEPGACGCYFLRQGLLSSKMNADSPCDWFTSAFFHVHSPSMTFVYSFWIARDTVRIIETPR